jgi:hypothetical protein
MHEEMHERTGDQQKIGKCGKNVARVVDEEIEPNCTKRERDHPAERGVNEGGAPVFRGLGGCGVHNRPSRWPSIVPSVRGKLL